MRSRADIKEIARGQFRQRYGMCVGATLLAILLGGMSSNGSLSIDYNLNDDFQTETMNVPWLLPVIIGIGAVVLLVSIFVSGPITVGYAGFTSRIFVGVETGVADMFRTGFRDYWRNVGGMLWMNLFIWLWSLLFIIPGIVKSYAYFATPYILAEFPGVDPTEALKISMRMTDGYKGDIFVLDLSFIGWNMLSAFTLGLLGVFYVNPYYGVSRAGMYQELKMNALYRGAVRYEELMGYPVPPNYA